MALTVRSGQGLACQEIMELRSVEQEIRHTRIIYTEIGAGEVY
jgi:hypothetical protein